MSGEALSDQGASVTPEMIERGARVLAGPRPPCYCPDDWRQPAMATCPAHGSGEWPDARHRRKAEKVLRAGLALDEETR